MGLFHDKCTAIVDAVTGEALTGDDLTEAKAQQAKWFGGHTLSNGRTWKICGYNVSKKARVCSKCGTRAPGGWVKCPVCHEWIGNESRFCPHCNHPIHPEERIDFAGGIWDHDAGLFAQRFEIEDAAKILKQGIHVQEGTVAVLLDSGKEAGILGPGRHTPDGTLRKINWFGNPPPRSVIMVDSGDVVFKLDFDGLRTADENVVRMVAEATLRFVPSRADDFIANYMKDARSVSYDEVSDMLRSESEYAAQNLCIKSNVEDLVKDPLRREALEDELSRTLRDLLKRCGLELVRVGSVDFLSAVYEEFREKYGELEKARRQFEYDQKLMELATSKEIAVIADEHAGIERTNEDAEFKAKKEQELFEYIEQLAQEKEIAAIDRAEEMEIIRKVSAGNISAKEAQLALARLQEAHAYRMADIANKLEIDLTLANYDREEQIRKAEHKAKLSDFDRAEAQKDAASEVVVYGTKVVGVAKADAEAETYKTQQVESQQKARKATIDTDIYEADKWVDIKRKKQDVEIDGEARRAEIKAKADAARANTVKGLSPVEIAALFDTPADRAAFISHADKLVEAGMTPEQILATLSPNATSAAALTAMYESKDKATQELLDEVRKMYGESLARDDRMNERYAQLVESLSAMMANTASTAAVRIDPAPVLPPTQQIIK